MIIFIVWFLFLCCWFLMWHDIVICVGMVTKHFCIDGCDKKGFFVPEYCGCRIHWLHPLDKYYGCSCTHCTHGSYAYVDSLLEKILAMPLVFIGNRSQLILLQHCSVVHGIWSGGVGAQPVHFLFEKIAKNSIFPRLQNYMWQCIYQAKRSPEIRIEN